MVESVRTCHDVEKNNARNKKGEIKKEIKKKKKE